MKTNKSLQVYYKKRLVGTLALTKDKRVAFEYDDNWLGDGFAISPFSLPLEKKVFLPNKTHYDGLFGVFADSLPDAWGRLLLDRVLLREGIKSGEVSVLDRLASMCLPIIEMITRKTLASSMMTKLAAGISALLMI